MAKIELTLTEEHINNFRKERWIDYASESVSVSHLLNLRLRMEINMAGDFRVSFGNRVRYEGSSVTEAIEMYKHLQRNGKM